MSKRLVGGAVLAFVGLTLAGCSSSSTSTTTTTAAKATTTTTTAAAAPAATTGGATPQDVATAFITALQSTDPSSFCADYAVSDQVSKCTSDVSVGGVTYKDLAVGQVHTEGDQAVITLTGTACQGSQCVSNSDPNVAMSGGKSFSDAFAAADNPNGSGSSAFAAAAVQQNGRWYASGF